MRAHVITVLSSLLLSACVMSGRGEEPPARTAEGYRIPNPGHGFSFPADHGSHPDFRIEWWYLTGHLRDGDGARYGFQATFFRYALHPETGGAAPDAFGTNQLFMAHMALTDVDNQRFTHEERLNRDGWDAYARVGDLDLRNGNWTLRRTEGETMQLQAGVRGDTRMSLQLVPVKPNVFFGEDGLSRKGADPSACSWYITFPRLAATGTLHLAGEDVAVTGEAWMDHEISSSQLGRDQVGWDWLSVRFEDGSELMLYVLRDQEGQPDPFSTLAWVTAEGQVHHAGPESFTWTVLDTWRSPTTGAAYPVHTRLTGVRPDGSPFAITVRPLMEAQEMHGRLGGISYWEGACDVSEDGKVVGEAYMELTGYADPLDEGLR
jgi:predicted secreted hydrolase